MEDSGVRIEWSRGACACVWRRDHTYALWSTMRAVRRRRIAAASVEGIGAEEMGASDSGPACPTMPLLGVGGSSRGGGRCEPPPCSASAAVPPPRTTWPTRRSMGAG